MIVTNILIIQVIKHSYCYILDCNTDTVMCKPWFNASCSQNGDALI